MIVELSQNTKGVQKIDQKTTSDVSDMNITMFVFNGYDRTLIQSCTILCMASQKYQNSSCTMSKRHCTTSKVRAGTLKFPRIRQNQIIANPSTNPIVTCICYYKLAMEYSISVVAQTTTVI